MRAPLLSNLKNSSMLEERYVHVPCGTLDQLPAAVASVGQICNPATPKRPPQSSNHALEPSTAGPERHAGFRAACLLRRGTDAVTRADSRWPPSHRPIPMGPSARPRPLQGTARLSAPLGVRPCADRAPPWSSAPIPRLPPLYRTKSNAAALPSRCPDPVWASICLGPQVRARTPPPPQFQPESSPHPRRPLSPPKMGRPSRRANAGPPSASWTRAMHVQLQQGQQCFGSGSPKGLLH